MVIKTQPDKILRTILIYLIYNIDGFMAIYL